MFSPNQNSGGPLTFAIAVAHFDSSEPSNPVAPTMSLNSRNTRKVPQGCESIVGARAENSTSAHTGSGSVDLLPHWSRSFRQRP